VTAPSKTSITNRALILLGSTKRMVSPDDASQVASAVEAIWPMLLEEVLAAHPWNFAIARYQASADVEAPPFGYKFYYQLPSDCLRWLPWNDDSEHFFVGEQEGDKLLTDAEAPINVRYIARIEDLSKWSPGAIGELVRALSVELAEVVTAREEILDRMDNAAERKLRDAKRQDGLATGSRQRNAVYRSNWLSGRQ